MNIVFDLGAVLFTWQPGRLLWRAFPEQVATQHEADQLSHQVFGHPDWHDFDRGILTMETVIDRIARRLALPVDALDHLVRSIGEHLTPIPDTVALLQRLHVRRQAGDGVAGLYYLSNMPSPYARFLERQHDFLRCFDGGIFSGDVHCIKPEPDIYQLLESRYALPPSRIVFIDDLQHNVDAATLRGWQGIRFESAAQLQAQLLPLWGLTGSVLQSPAAWLGTGAG